MTRAPVPDLPELPKAPEAPEANDRADAAPRRADARFMLSHPAHLLALGFGSGLSPIAPGTAGTVWAWLSFVVFDAWLSDAQWGLAIGAGLLLGWWACTRTARALGVCDPSAIVWDEVLAFWTVLWLAMPMDFGGQLVAFALFRLFDAAKPGPVGWADGLFKAPRGALPGWREGFGILFDDAVAALCTLFVLALWRAFT